MCVCVSCFQHLDDSNQRTLLRIFKMKPREEIDDDQVRKILRLAPDVIDDDFLESLPDQVFQSKSVGVCCNCELTSGGKRGIYLSIYLSIYIYI